MELKLFGITGWKNSGKTTLTEKLVRELVRRGYRIATIKHAHHDFDIDHKGTDSWRHRAAGASEVAIVSSARYAIMHENRGEQEPSLHEIAAKLSPCDLVIVEGYKNESHPKIEARRLSAQPGPALHKDDPHIVAIASDHLIDHPTLPTFSIDDVANIAEFVEHYTGLQKSR